jgi:hypothetical protein
VFKRGEPEGMHLKEYTCRELFEAAGRAGFGLIRYGCVPKRFRMMLIALGAKRFARSDEVGILFLRIVFLVEKALRIFPASALRRLCGNLFCKFGVFPGTISLVAEK